MGRICGLLGLASLVYGVIALSTGDRVSGVDGLILAALGLTVWGVTRKRG